MPYVKIFVKRKITKAFLPHNLKIVFYILLVSIVAGIITVEIAGLFTQPKSMSSVLKNMDNTTKEALKTQFKGMGSEEKEALKRKIKEMTGEE